MIHNIGKMGDFIKDDDGSCEMCIIHGSDYMRVGIFWISHVPIDLKEGEYANGYTLGEVSVELTYQEALDMKKQLESIR
jgi:hypothetical protein